VIFLPREVRVAVVVPVTGAGGGGVGSHHHGMGLLTLASAINLAVIAALQSRCLVLRAVIPATGAACTQLYTSRFLEGPRTDGGDAACLTRASVIIESSSQ
jgi:hypothetical protein